MLAECRNDYGYAAAIKYMYQTVQTKVKIAENHYTDKVKIERRLRRGDALSLKLFIALLQSMLNKINWENVEINIDREWLNHRCFADDIVLIITDNIQEAQLMLEILNNDGSKIGLKINLTKTHFITNLVLRNALKSKKEILEQTHIYKYLGHEISIGRHNQTFEIRRRTCFLGGFW